MSRTRGRSRPPVLQWADPATAATAAGLRYVTCTGPGIRRRRVGRGFIYRAVDGRNLPDEQQLRRIRALAIPPAWREVWICPTAHGHLQAVGVDARGRRQYRYHPRWRGVRDKAKYDHMLAFGRTLPRIRTAVNRDLARQGLCRRRVLAAIVRLLETTFVRVGNSEYARENGSFGLTTLRNRHAQISGATITLQFKSKGGKRQVVDMTDPRVARVVRRCRDLPGYDLFQYVDQHGQLRQVESGEVNAYLKEISGQDITAKDFRTWAGTVLAAMRLQEFEAVDSKAEGKRNVVRAVQGVAKKLGNTPAICRKSYVHPAIIDAYLEGEVLSSPEEASVLMLLERRLRRDPSHDLARAA